MTHPKIARMHQPDALKSDAYQPWSRGRGVDVWDMLCASITGDLDTIRTLVARDPNLVGCSYEYLTPIRFAVRENHRAIVDFLIERGADPAYEAGDSLLTLARDHGHGDLAAFLESTLRARYHIVPEGAAVAGAIRDRDVARVRALLDAQPALLHAADERGNQPIHWAAMTRQLDVLDDLLARGADVNARRPDGARPIDLTNGDYHYRGWRDLPPVALRRHEIVIGYLLARGAECDISVAAKIGDLDRVREWLDGDLALANRVPSYTTYYSGLPLRCAAGGGHLEVVKLLLERGADPNDPEPGIAPHGGALHAAIGGGHYDIVRLLLERGANPNAAVESSGNCFWMAKHTNAPRDIVELIASHGGVLTVPMICYDGDVETMAALLHANPQLHLGDHSLHNAISEGHRTLVELILRCQPDIIDRVDPSSATSPELASWLIERGANPNRRNWLGIAPLHRCAAGGRIDIAGVCLDAGADIDAIDGDSSSTPLGWAARHGRAEMVHWLLQKGAKANVPDADPWARPAAWAAKRGHDDIVSVLGQHGA